MLSLCNVPMSLLIEEAEKWTMKKEKLEDTHRVHTAFTKPERNSCIRNR